MRREREREKEPVSSCAPSLSLFVFIVVKNSLSLPWVTSKSFFLFPSPCFFRPQLIHHTLFFSLSLSLSLSLLPFFYSCSTFFYGFFFFFAWRAFQIQRNSHVGFLFFPFGFSFFFLCFDCAVWIYKLGPFFFFFFLGRNISIVGLCSGWIKRLRCANSSVVFCSPDGERG